MCYTKAIMEQKKRCHACRELLPRAEFSKHSSEKDGLQRKCKSCTSAYMKAQYVKTRESRLAYQKSYRLANKEKLKAYFAAHYKSDLEKNRASRAAYRKAHPKQSTIRARKYRAANLEKTRARALAWANANSEQLGDNYVRAAIVRVTKLKRTDIPDALVEVKRMLLKVHRAIKTLSKNDRQKLELQQNSYSIGDLQREIKQYGDNMRRDQGNARRSNDSPSGQKDRCRRSEISGTSGKLHQPKPKR